MNGTINMTAVTGIVTRELAAFSDRIGTDCAGNNDASGEAVRALMFRIGEAVERASKADIDEVAYDVVDRDMRGTDVGSVHKIADIKEVRTITMSGLREAKEAVEYAIGRVLRDRANEALNALDRYNTTGDGYHKPGYRQYVSAVAHKEVLTDMWEASKSVPF